MSEFAGKTILITGAGRGLGRSTALAFGAAGANVCVNYSNSADGANAVVSDIEAAGGRAIACQADISDSEKVKVMVDETLTELGPTIRVNGLGLGFVDSPIVRELFSNDQIAQVVDNTPLKRMTSYDETAAFIKLLASESASFVTGQTIMFDGGRNMR